MNRPWYLKSMPLTMILWTAYFWIGVFTHRSPSILWGVVAFFAGMFGQFLINAAIEHRES